MSTQAAQIVPSNDANLFDLEGCGITIHYSKSSITGQPLFSYRDSNHDVSVSGSDIEVEATRIGDLVTIQLAHVPDLHILTVSILVPEFQLPASNETAFETVAVLTRHLMSIGGPGFVQGQTKVYESAELSGTAKQVVF